LSAKNFTNADAGTLYLISDDKKFLEFWVVCTNSLDIKMCKNRKNLTWAPLPLYDENNRPNRHLVALTCALDKKLYNFEDVYDAWRDLILMVQRLLIKILGYRTKSIAKLVPYGR